MFSKSSAQFARRQGEMGLPFLLLPASSYNHLHQEEPDNDPPIPASNRQHKSSSEWVMLLIMDYPGERTLQNPTVCYPDTSLQSQDVDNYSAQCQMARADSLDPRGR